MTKYTKHDLIRHEGHTAREPRLDAEENYEQAVIEA
jgi:hypothetical protein